MTELKPQLMALAQVLGPPIQDAPRDAAARLAALPLVALPLSIGGRAVTLGLTRAQIPQNAVTIALEIGDAGAVLQAPPALLDWLAVPLELTERLADTPAHRAILLEYAALDLITACETALDLPIRVVPAAGTQPKVALGLHLQTGTGDFACQLRLTEELAGLLADHLETLQPPVAADPGALPVTLTLSLGRQFLTRAEIATLAPGDVVMLEPGPAMAQVTGDFGAAIALDAQGAVLQSDLLPLPPRTPTPDLLEPVFRAAQSDTTLGALNALAPGDRLPLAVFADMAVDIVIDGRIAGRGQQIAIGAGSGIRILQLHLPDGPQ